MKKILLIDANSFIHRSFHALPPLTTPSGKPSGALYGLTNTLLKTLQDEEPDCVAAAFDTPEKTFREKIFKDYKAHRPKTPNELKEQIIAAQDVFDALNIKVFKSPGFEADDILATIAKKLKREGTKIIIMTGDFDVLQAVDNKKVVVLIPKRGVSKMKKYDEEKVVEKYGIPPNMLAEYKGLVGDSSDNIPGVPGIGPKTALSLLKDFGDIENAEKNLRKKKKPSKSELSLIQNKKQALLSKDLATLKSNVPMSVTAKDISWKMPKESEVESFFNRLGFKTTLKKLKKQERLI